MSILKEQGDDGVDAEIRAALETLADEFLQAKEAFLADYDRSIQGWIKKHRQWGDIIRNSTVSPDYVRSRMDFKWQMFKVAPLMQHDDEKAVLEAGLAEEVTNLGSPLFSEIAKTADEIWHKVYEGRTEVTHKALSPLKTLHQKLMGLSFVEPHVSPVADIVQTALKRMPAKGNILGADLLMLQGLVCLLRDSDALLTQAQSLMEGYGPATVLDGLLCAPATAVNRVSRQKRADIQGQNPVTTMPLDEEAVMPQAIATLSPVPEIPSLGLW